MNKKTIIMSGIIALFMFFPFLKIHAEEIQHFQLNYDNQQFEVDIPTSILQQNYLMNITKNKSTNIYFLNVYYNFDFVGIRYSIDSSIQKEFMSFYFNQTVNIYQVNLSNKTVKELTSNGVPYFAELDKITNNYVLYNLPFSYNKKIYLDGSNINANLTYKINNIDYKKGDEVTLGLPTISFSMTDSESFNDYGQTYYYSKTIETKFSSIDNSKYYYEVSNDLFEDNVETIMLTESNSFTRKFTENGTFSVRIKDRITNETIAINTLTLSGIRAHVVDNIQYKSMIKIPISDFYDSTTQKWKSKVIFARGRKDNDTNIQLRFEFENEDISNKEEFPILLYVDNDILNINDYMNKYTESPESNVSGFGGGLSLTTENGFGGGGGGGRFGDSCSELPISYSRETYSKSKYVAVKFLTNNCNDLTGKTPADFKTKNIVVYYNATLFSSEEQILNDYTSSLPGFEQDDDGNTTIGKFYNMILKKFPIVEQLGTIINKFSNMNFTDETPKFEIDLSSIVPGIQKMSVIDLDIYLQYRDYVFMFIKASCIIILIPKIFRIISSFFGGAES